MTFEKAEFKTAEDALAFIEANKLMFTGKTGFKHFVADLDALQKFVADLAEENAQLKERLTEQQP